MSAVRLSQLEKCQVQSLTSNVSVSDSDIQRTFKRSRKDLIFFYWLLLYCEKFLAQHAVCLITTSLAICSQLCQPAENNSKAIVRETPTDRGGINGVHNTFKLNLDLFYYWPEKKCFFTSNLAQPAKVHLISDTYIYWCFRTGMTFTSMKVTFWMLLLNIILLVLLVDSINNIGPLSPDPVNKWVVINGCRLNPYTVPSARPLRRCWLLKWAKDMVSVCGCVCDWLPLTMPNKL